MKLNEWSVGAALTIISCSANAAGDVGPYIGGNLGLASISASNVQQGMEDTLLSSGHTSASASMDSKGLGFKLLAGYQFSRYFAAEAFYANFDKYKITYTATGPASSGSGYVKPKATGVDILGMLPLSSFQTGFVRVGYFRMVDDTFTINGNPVAVSNNGSYYKLGLGIEWKDEVESEPRVRSEIEYYNNNDLPIITLTLGLVAHF